MIRFQKSGSDRETINRSKKMIITSTKVSKWGHRLKDGKLEGTFDELELVPVHAKLVLDEVNGDQYPAILEFIKNLNNDEIGTQLNI